MSAEHVGTSRYDDAPVYRITVVGENGPMVVPAVYAPEYMSRPWSFEFSSHRVTAGERLDLIATQYYGDPSLWWVIARANPEVPYPMEIEEASLLRIPHAG